MNLFDLDEEERLPPNPKRLEDVETILGALRKSGAPKPELIAHYEEERRELIARK